MSARPGPTPAGWYPAPGEPGLLRLWDGVAWSDERKPERAADGTWERVGPLAFGAGDALGFVAHQLDGSSPTQDSTPQTRAATFTARLGDVDQVLADADAYATSGPVAERLPLVSGGAMVADALVGFDVKSPLGLRLGLVGAAWLALWGGATLLVATVWNVVPWGHDRLPGAIDVLTRVSLPLLAVAMLVTAAIVAVRRAHRLAAGSVLLARGGRDAVDAARHWDADDVRKDVSDAIYATRALRKKGL